MSLGDRMDNLCSTKRDLRLNSSFKGHAHGISYIDRDIDYQTKTVEAYLSGKNVFVSAPFVVGKS